MKHTIRRIAVAALLVAAVCAATALPTESAEAQPAGAGTFYIVNLKASNGQFVVAEWGGEREVKANRNAAGDWERFVVIDVNGGNLMAGDQVRLRAQNGSFVVAEKGLVKANRTTGAAWETFKILKAGGGTGAINSNDKINLQAWDNRWVVAERGGGAEVKADRTAAGAWEAFTLTFRSRLTKDPSPLGKVWTPTAAAPPTPQLPPGFRLVGDPECSPQTRLTAYLGRDMTTGDYYCCDFTANPNAHTTHCGDGHIEFQPDCRQFSPKGQLLQPHGCVERTP